MIFSYRLTLTGEPQQLPIVKPKLAECQFSTPATNSGAVYLADTPISVETISNRFAIAAGKEFPLKITDLSQLYADGTSGDCLDMICETKPAILKELLKIQTLKPKQQEGGK